nr:Mur ligase family, glutamate ligase domain protein [uncultured bacterium]
MSNIIIQQAVPLAKLTSWHIGGKAEYFAQPTHLDELKTIIADRKSLNITWLGLGSNVLIRDAGIQGLVIATRGLNQIKLQENALIYVEAGVACAKLARFCQKHGLGGGEFFAGIPGTIGGALTMNAGAFGGETWECVQSVDVIDEAGLVSTHHINEFEVSYRRVLPNFSKFLGFVGGLFQFKSFASEEGKEKIRQLLQKRQEAQPIGTFNCGSVYRNPEGLHAAKLIDECGFRGKRIGDAMVSEKHANFILNTGKASAQQVEALMKEIEETVLERFQVKLEREVKILGHLE